MTRAPSLALAVALALSQVSCSSEERTPEGTARLLVRAIKEGDNEQAYDLLAPQTHKRLEQLADLATAQTGGRNKLKPQDLLIGNMSRLPVDPALQVKPRSVNGDRAEVELIGKKHKVRHVLRMVRIKGRWRVLLPEDSLTLPDPSAPVAGPATRPASRPAETQ